ncbi:MAG: hypothetical protein GC206_04880 [Alphaproteobacteria bacterium]|nr:hypothetical protein [Alphaproteobacteria bacterium]
MPLLSSPIDGAPMRQIHRYGIEFDVCPSTGGVWLDKGELEKLIALVKEETLNERGAERGRGRYDDDDDDDHDRRQRHGGGRRSRLADLFDF